MNQEERVNVMESGKTAGMKANLSTWLIILCQLEMLLTHIWRVEISFIPISINVLAKIALGLAIYLKLLQIHLRGGNWKRVYVVIIIGALSTFLMLLSYIFTQSPYILPNHLITLLYYLPLAALITTFDYDIMTIARFQVLTMLALLVIGLAGFSFDKVFHDVSRNYVSTYFLLLIFPLVVHASYFKHKDRLPIYIVVISLLAVFASVTAVGRSGFAFTTLFFLVACYFAFFSTGSNRTTSRTFLYIVIGLVILGVVLLLVSGQYTRLVGRFIGSRASTLEEEPRFMIWESYLRSMNSVRSIVFGSTLADGGIIQEYNFNPHNSFIFSHSNYGLFYLLFVVVQLVLFGWKTYKRGYLFLLCYMLVFLGRSFFDIVFGPNLGDQVILFIFMMNAFGWKDLEETSQGRNLSGSAVVHGVD